MTAFMQVGFGFGIEAFALPGFSCIHAFIEELGDPVARLPAGAEGRALAAIRSSPMMMKPALNCYFILDHSFGRFPRVQVST
ncbi:hypothetical protein [Streptomyces sp. NPDC004680]|uniref:hypothetical protein n=1 Tax=Streptomyces sp. NPDC004680 TaxID=3154287 RepID=UPI0033A7A40D